MECVKSDAPICAQSREHTPFVSMMHLLPQLRLVILVFHACCFSIFVYLSKMGPLTGFMQGLRWLREKGATSDINLEMLVAEKMFKQRLVFARSIASLLAVPFSVIILFAYIGIMPRDKFRNVVDDGVMTFGYFSIVALSCAGNRLNVEALNLASSTLMGCLALWLSPLAVIDQATFEERHEATIAILFGMMISLMNLQAPWYISWNMICLVSHSYSCVLYDPTVGRLCENFVVFIMVVSILYIFEYTISADFRHQIRLKIEQDQSCALAFLLDMMSDAVVEVDTDLHMVDDAVNFASMLMYGRGGQTSFKGRLLQEFMPHEEDRHRYEEALGRKGTEDQTQRVGIVTGRLREASGMLVKAHLHHVSFASKTGDVHHLVGIKEAVESVIPEPERGAGLGMIFEESRQRQGTGIGDCIGLQEMREHITRRESSECVERSSSCSSMSSRRSSGSFCSSTSGLSSSDEAATIDSSPLRAAKEDLVGHGIARRGRSLAKKTVRSEPSRTCSSRVAAVAIPARSPAASSVSLLSIASSPRPDAVPTCMGRAVKGTLQVDFRMEEGFPVSVMSKAFAKRYGYGPTGTPLAQWFSRSPDFLEWLRDRWRMMTLNHGADLPKVEEFGYAHITPVDAVHLAEEEARDERRLLMLRFVSSGRPGETSADEGPLMIDCSLRIGSSL